MARAPIAAVIMLLAGCFPPGYGGSGVDGGGPVGFGAPTIEVTINGVHFGPAMPLAGAGADVTTTKDALTGRVVDTTLQISGTSTVNASCNLAFERSGDGVTPFYAAAYEVSVATIGSSVNNTVAPIGGESVTVPQGTWQCTGSSCSGATLVIRYLAADHIEGTLSGTFQDTAGVGESSVVCSFYLPMRSFN